MQLSAAEPHLWPTCSMCPVNVSFSCPDARSQNLIVLSPDPLTNQALVGSTRAHRSKPSMKGGECCDLTAAKLRPAAERQLPAKALNLHGALVAEMWRAAAQAMTCDQVVDLSIGGHSVLCLAQGEDQPAQAAQRLVPNAQWSACTFQRTLTWCALRNAQHAARRVV